MGEVLRLGFVIAIAADAGVLYYTGRLAAWGPKNEAKVYAKRSTAWRGVQSILRRGPMENAITIEEI